LCFKTPFHARNDLGRPIPRELVKIHQLKPRLAETARLAYPMPNVYRSTRTIPACVLISVTTLVDSGVNTSKMP